MGKRRSRKAAPVAARAKLPTTFDCPFCNHQSTIFVKIGKLSNVGKLECRVCGVKHEQRTTHLTSEIDVFCEWMDKCEEQNKQDAGQTRRGLDDIDLDEPLAKRRRVDDRATANEEIAAVLEQISDVSDDPYYQDSIASDEGALPSTP